MSKTKQEKAISRQVRDERENAVKAARGGAHIFLVVNQLYKEMGERVERKGGDR